MESRWECPRATRASRCGCRASRRAAAPAEHRPVARKKRKSTLRPKVPKRVKTRKKSRRPRSEHHPELIGLGLAALGLFLASILYARWDGGLVGGGIADGFGQAFGAAAYAAPLALTVIGGLMVFRSALVDVRPFRTGLPILAFGLLLALGREHGGY